jgi:hypothetical protein
MYRQRQRYFISENADLLADLRIFYKPTGLAFGLLKQESFCFKSRLCLCALDFFIKAMKRMLSGGQLGMVETESAEKKCCCDSKIKDDGTVTGDVWAEAEKAGCEEVS